MISVLLRKLRSSLRMLRQSPQPIQDLRRLLRENWFALSRGHNAKPFCYRVAPGFPFACMPSSASSRAVFLHSYLEQVEAIAATRWLQAGDACIDVGANVGYFACLFAEYAGRSGKVIALEASPRTFDILRQIVSLLELPQVVLENVCALDAERMVRFMEATSNDLADVEQSLHVDDSQRDRFHEVEVQGTTIDVLVRKQGIENRVSIVKIDVEGAEPLVLKGAAALFQSTALPFFIVEIHQIALGNFQATAQDVLAFFPAARFHRFIVPHSLSDATPERPYGVPRVYAESEPLPTYCNLLALPREGEFAGRAKALAGLLPGLAS
jgi:FkbM family methyltransferase